MNNVLLNYILGKELIPVWFNVKSFNPLLKNKCFNPKYVNGSWLNWNDVKNVTWTIIIAFNNVVFPTGEINPKKTIIIEIIPINWQNL